MNNFLLCAFQLQQQHQTNESFQLSIFTDAPTQYPYNDLQRMLAPWAAWVRIRDYLVLSDRINAETITKLGITSDARFVALANNPTIQEAVHNACLQVGATLIEPAYPPVDTLENALLQELVFHDVELGGRNEWDGAPTQFSDVALRKLSATHCREVFPVWAFEDLEQMVKAKGRRLKALDIGCGPISHLRWGALNNYLTVTGVDPLLKMYAIILARHGLDQLPAIRCDREVPGFGENLDTLIADEDFEVVFTNNALDHTQVPARVVENIGKKLSPEGLAIIQVATREGTRQNWDQLHKTDIYLNDQILMYCHQHGPEQPLLSLTSRLRLKSVPFYSPDFLACVLEKY